MPPIAGRMVELNQRQLDLLMPGVSSAFALAKHRINAVRVSGEGVEQLPLPRGLLMGHGGFHQVARTVQLVPVAQIGPARLRLHDGEVHIQIPIGLLRTDNQRSHLLDHSLRLAVRMCRQGIARGLEPLGHIGIPEDVRRVGLSRLPVELERVEAAGGLALLVLVRDGDFAVDLLTLRPEAVGDLDVR